MKHNLSVRRLWRIGLALLVVGIAAPGLVSDAAVSLAEFKATAQNNVGILVYWETATEFETLAFSLFRSESSQGPWGDPISEQPAEGDGVTGAIYTYLDEDVAAGTLYFYLLTEIPSSGEGGVFGPISAVMGQTLTPTRTQTPTATATQVTNLGGTMTPTVTSTRTPTPSSTTFGDQNSLPPTVTRQFTNTPVPALPALPPPAVPDLTAPLAPLVAPPTLLPGQAVLTTPTSGAPAATALPLLVMPTAVVMPGALPPDATATLLPTVSSGATVDQVTPNALAMAATSVTPAVFEARSTSSPLISSDRPRATPAPGGDDEPARQTSFVLILAAIAVVLALVLVAALVAVQRRKRI